MSTSIQPAGDVEPNGAQPLPRPDGSLAVVYAVGAAEDDEGGDGFRVAPLSAAVYAAMLDGRRGQLSFERRDLEPARVADARPAGTGAPVGRRRCRRPALRLVGGLPLRPTCSRDRIVLSTSPDGLTWSRPAPIGPTTAGADQVVPGLAVDPASASGQSVAVAYNSMPADCAARPSCPGIDVWLTTSPNGGASWTRPQRLDAVPMRLSWLPRAGGRFFGDYISTSFADESRRSGLLARRGAVRRQVPAGDHGAPAALVRRTHRSDRPGRIGPGPPGRCG